MPQIHESDSPEGPNSGRQNSNDFTSRDSLASRTLKPMATREEVAVDDELQCSPAVRSRVTGLNVVHLRTETLELSFRTAVVDNDETLVIGSGEHIHDGYKARFAVALSKYLAEVHEAHPELNVLNDQQIASLKLIGSIFEATWVTDGFKQQTGKSEEAVIQSLLQVAHTRFVAPNVARLGAGYNAPVAQKLCSNAFSVHLTEALDECLRMLPTLERENLVVLDNSLIRTLSMVRAAGGKTVVCSASSDKFVKPALQYFNAAHHFDGFVCGATKKVSDNIYSGTDIGRAIAQVDGRPTTSVMFGDSISDAAACLTGVEYTVLCPRVPAGMDPTIARDELECELLKLLSRLASFTVEGDSNLRVTPTVFIVHDFKQIKFGGLPQKDSVEHRIYD